MKWHFDWSSRYYWLIKFGPVAVSSRPFLWSNSFLTGLPICTLFFRFVNTNDSFTSISNLTSSYTVMMDSLHSFQLQFLHCFPPPLRQNISGCQKGCVISMLLDESLDALVFSPILENVVFPTPTDKGDHVLCCSFWFSKGSNWAPFAD